MTVERDAKVMRLKESGEEFINLLKLLKWGRADNVHIILYAGIGYDVLLGEISLFLT